MAKFKPYQKDQLHFLPSSLEEYVPEGHLARLVYEVVEGIDTSKIEKKYSKLGQNTYHPRILLKLLFYGYATGVRSGRKIAALCESDTAFMYLSEMYRPDFRTINDFRKNNLKEIEECFVEIVRICKELGMIKIGRIYIDGSKLRANASAKRTKDKALYEKWLKKTEEEIREILKEAEATDRKEDMKYGDKRGDELPEGIRKKETLKAKIEKVLTEFKKEDKKINLTDSDSRFMKERKGIITPSYNCQVSVTEEQIIVGGEVVVDENDRKQFIPMIEETEKVLVEDVEEVIADRGYGSYDNYEYLSDNEKEGYIPDQYFEKDKNGEYSRSKMRYHKENFIYDKKNNKYICPEGKELKFYKDRDSDKGVMKRKQWIYKGKECHCCKVKSQCTKAKYRTIAREKREELRDKMRQKLKTKEGKEKYKKRMHLVESIFGHIKYNLGYKRFLLRTLEKVRGEFKLMCIGYNLKKIFRYKMATG